MTSTRAWLYNVLLNDSALHAIHSGRVFQSTMRTANLPKPYLVYHMGNDTDENLAEAGKAPHRQFFQVYIYDEGGDYSQIDAIGILVKNALRNANKPDTVITTRYLETSQDLDDETLACLFRYLRFQLIMVGG